MPVDEVGKPMWWLGCTAPVDLTCSKVSDHGQLAGFSLPMLIDITSSFDHPAISSFSIVSCLVMLADGHVFINYGFRK